MGKKKNTWRINEQIFSPELRVIGEDGKQIGVISRNEALKLSREAGVDLVEIAPMAKPPVAKIVEFGKFQYQEEKKLRSQKKKARVNEIKEIRFSPFIAEGDYQTRIKRLEEFLSEGFKARIVVVFKGRHMGSKQFGYKLIKRIIEHFGERVVVDMEPKFIGRHLAVVISPVKKAKGAGKDGKAENKKIGSQSV